MGKKSPPSADPRIGEAALQQAQLGKDYLAFMQGQAGITNGWAAEDRDRYMSVFQPLQDDYIKKAEDYASPERKAQAANEAITDVRQQSGIARAGNERRMAAMGVNPASGRFAGEVTRGGNTEALAAAGAGNMARRQVEATGDGMMANVLNMGQGLAVNPGTSMGLANGASNAGFSGAMQGNNSMMNGLQAQQNHGMQVWQQQQSGMNSLFSGIGMAAGAFLSDEDSKKNRRKAVGVLDAVKAMDIDEYDYKPGKGDGGHHVGPMAQDFKRETGLGNGREISIQDAIGVTMGAVKELAQKVDKIAGKSA